MRNGWHQIWEEKGVELGSGGGLHLLNLIRADGFDQGAGAHTLDTWMAFCDAVHGRLGLDSGSRLLDVGCGSGAFSYTAYQLGCQVTGIDYSHALLCGARAAMPNAQFALGEAAKLPVANDRFDIAVCHSVFQYFPTQEYAAETVLEMCRISDKDKGRLAILDINDKQKERLYYQVRRGQFDKGAYDEKYEDYPHRFYEKSWFEQLLSARGYRVEVLDQDIDGYSNSKFRFNVFAFADH